ncbi:MAG: nucleotidyltransferase domain-containing protein [Gammaproteobacteria bacterium]|nr:nucleotidyltransferase domain-containing protein [Gammaproteobacteria bacterium]
METMLSNTPMRLSKQQIQAIRELVAQLAGNSAEVRVFGSRLDDHKRGGDLDLLVELPDAVENPALLTARLSACISRAMNGRKVDVVLSAPNLRHLPIHDVAFKEGQPL